MPAPAQKFLNLSSPMLQFAETRDRTKHNLVTELLRTAGNVQLAAFGYSMLPTLWPGDLLNVQARTFVQVDAEEVVLYARDDRFFIHRVLQKTDMEAERFLITRGDALPGPDAPVQPHEILGSVITVRRKGRDVPVPGRSACRRGLGLLLTASVRLRSLALRWRAWRSPAAGAESELGSGQVLSR